MNSSILVSRIVRVIETLGKVGQGAELAKQYNDAVKNVNERLEAVLSSIESKQISDAVRLMEDSPRLLDEVGTLDFNQNLDWEALCERRQWPMPVKIDKSLLERVLIFCESKDTIEPFLKMYRKAIRLNDNRLAMQSLRQLAKVDTSQNWAANLQQAESAVTIDLVKEFQKSISAGNLEEADRIATEMEETSWSAPPKCKGVEELHEFYNKRRAEARDALGMENLNLLRGCVQEWNLQLVVKILDALDALQRDGWTVSGEPLEIIEVSRARANQELKAAAFDKRWQELCGEMEGVINAGNVAQLRIVISSDEFIEREPPQNLIDEAKSLLLQDKKRRRRRNVLIGMGIAACILSVFAVAIFALDQHLIRKRCEGEIAKLEQIASEPRAVENLKAELQNLKEIDPTVYSRSEISAFKETLVQMEQKELARTTEINRLLAELRDIESKSWSESGDVVNGKLAKIDALIKPEDQESSSSVAAIKSSWTSHLEQEAANNKDSAIKYAQAIISNAESIASSLMHELMSAELESKLLTCKSQIEEWHKLHSAHAIELVEKVNEAKRKLVDAEDTQHKFAAMIKEIEGATTLKDMLLARKRMQDGFGSYDIVRDMGSLSYTAEEAECLMQGTLPPQVQYNKLVAYGIDADAFSAFLSDYVIALQGIPSFSSLYGIYNARGWEYFALSKGPKPNFRKPSYDKGVVIEGDLLDLKKCEVSQRINKNNSFDPKFHKLASTEEVQSVIDIASEPNLTSARFETEILKLMGKHLKAAIEPSFKKDEEESAAKIYDFAKDRYPAIRRMQMMYLYMTWLKEDLKLMPNDKSLNAFYEKVERLAQPVKIDGVPEDLTWACMKENRVRERNVQCAALLSQMVKSKILEVYKKGKVESKILLSIARIKYVQMNSEDENVPVYILRKDSERFFMKKVEKGVYVAKWEPKFVAELDGERIDAEKKIKSELEKLQPQTIKRIATKIPFFKMEVR